ncbi:MAG: MFS transporter [Marinosulfonomonas sp.]|nr:MFS transporter [Marinosulfonomonas sp.]
MRSRFQDLSAVFAIRPFAIYQAGHITMTIGLWMQRIAIGWVVWTLTGSEAWLGAIAFAELFPSIFTGILGGRLADRISTTRVMYWGQIANAFVSILLAVLHYSGALTPGAIVGAMVFFGAINGFLLPARLSMASFLAPPHLLPSALAVNSTGFNLSRLIGPAISAGLLLVSSATIVFAITAICFLVFARVLHVIRDVPRQSPARAPMPKAGTLKVFRDVMATPIIFGIILLQFAQGLLLRPANELFPAFSELAFDMGEVGLGALNAALGGGAIIGALALSKARATMAALRQIFVTSAFFALSLIAFSLTQNFGLALFFLVVHGASMASSNIAAMTFVQIRTPQERLGRVLSLYTAVYRVGPALGAFLFGITAEATSLAVTGVGFGVVGLGATVALAIYIMRPSVDKEPI